MLRKARAGGLMRCFENISGKILASVDFFVSLSTRFAARGMGTVRLMVFGASAPHRI